jgi:RHS repeat-associated protein
MRERNGRSQEVRLIGEHHENGLDGRSVYYAHTDYRNAPRILTDEDQSVAWRAEYTPFGTAIVTVNRVENNLRLPGQYFDSETALHYNYHRYYDPSTGRYITSDPIGLEGGLNTYLYAKANPLRYIDPLGLYTELCYRAFYPIPQPYARHCFIRFDGDNTDTLGFDKDGVHPDPAPSWWPKSCEEAGGGERDDCLRREMNKCEASQYDFTGFNCCHCTEEAMKACGIYLPRQSWPNWPVNPGPQLGETGYTP